MSQLLTRLDPATGEHAVLLAILPPRDDEDVIVLDDDGDGPNSHSLTLSRVQHL